MTTLTPIKRQPPLTWVFKRNVAPYLTQATPTTRNGVITYNNTTKQ